MGGQGRAARRVRPSTSRDDGATNLGVLLAAGKKLVSTHSRDDRAKGARYRALVAGYLRSVARIRAKETRDCRKVTGYPTKEPDYRALVTRYRGPVTRYQSEVTRDQAEVARYLAEITRDQAEVARHLAEIARDQAEVARYLCGDSARPRGGSAVPGEGHARPSGGHAEHDAKELSRFEGVRLHDDKLTRVRSIPSLALAVRWTRRGNGGPLNRRTSRTRW